jgi:hypothetical protein
MLFFCVKFINTYLVLINTDFAIILKDYLGAL